MIYISDYASPLGLLMLAVRDDALVGIWWKDQKTGFKIRQDDVVAAPSHPLLSETRAWLDSYFAQQRPSIRSLPLSPDGSDFRRRVWDLLCDIPYGETTTYGAIAQKVSRKCGVARMSAQAVGGAVGHNPLAIIIPCHRVVGADGNLTGYAAGMDKKIRLLTHEGADLTKLYIPRYGMASKNGGIR